MNKISFGRKVTVFGASAALAFGSIFAMSAPSQANEPLVVSFEDSTEFLFGTGNDFGCDGAEWCAASGNQVTTIVTDAPAGFNGTKAMRMSRGGQTWAGTTVFKSASWELATTDHLIATAMIHSPAAGKTLRLKLENKDNDQQTVETNSTVLSVEGWATYTFNFANQAEGTAAFNDAFIFNKASLFLDFGSTTTGTIFYVDDVTFDAMSTTPPEPKTAPSTVVTFESDDETGYIQAGFEGAVSDLSSVPTGGNGGVGLKITRTGGQVYAGVTVLNVSAGTTKITSADNKVITMNFHTVASVPVMVQVKLGVNIIEKTVVAPAGWSKLTFDFGSELSSGTYADDVEYGLLTLFPNFGTLGAGEIVYVDNIAFNGGSTPAIPVVVVKTAQTIGTTAATMKVGKMLALRAKTSANLTIKWTSKTKAICVMAGTSAAPKVKSLKVGTCKITGTNAGNSTKRAVTVNRNILVKK